MRSATAEPRAPAARGAALARAAGATEHVLARAPGRRRHAGAQAADGKDTRLVGWRTRPLPRAFYARPVVEVARALIGCVLEHDGVAGVIVESEAYHDSEPACHAYAGLTPRTRTLFGPPGRAYVYRSYGVHALFNAVCEREGVGAAVLVRALEPLTGAESMRARRLGGRGGSDIALCSGPGKLAQALGIELRDNDTVLQRGALVIRERPRAWRSPEIVAARRIGITKGVELPWRFCAAGSRYVSRPLPRPG